MTLYNIVDALKKIALMQPNMRYAVDGSVYQLDQKPDIEYNAFCVTQTKHREDEMTTWYGFNLFYISRLDDTMEDNRLQIQSNGKEVLSNIIRTFCNHYDIDVPEQIVYHPFTQKFVDTCAGVYCDLTFEIPVEWICDEEYGSITEIDPSPAKPTQHKSIRITSNGHFTVFPDDDYYALSSVDITVDVESTGRTTYYDTLGRVYDYLYDATYSRLDYDYAYDYFKQRGPQPNIGACTSVRDGMEYGRNLDWYYSNEVDCIIRTQNTIGIAGGLTGLTKHIAETDPYDENYHILPFFLQDGVNKDGVFANINVVTQESVPTTYTTPLVSKELELCGLMLVRYVLDHFHTAREAVEYLRDHVSLYFPTSLQEQNYECHYMIGDRDETFVLEIIDNEVKIIEDQNILTNFYLYDTTANTDGSFYSIIDVPTHDPMEENGLQRLSSGVERYNLALAGIEQDLSMREIMNSLLYTKTYTKDVFGDFWFSEYVGGELGIGDDVSTYLENGRIGRTVSQYERRDRNNPNTWQTTHSVVYNLTALTLDILSQETDSYGTSLYSGDYEEGYQDGYEQGHEDGFEEGFEEGEVSQKSKLTVLNVDKNGTYTRGDGWNVVNVNIDEGKLVDFYRLINKNYDDYDDFHVPSECHRIGPGTFSEARFTTVYIPDGALILPYAFADFSDMAGIGGVKYVMIGNDTTISNYGLTNSLIKSLSYSEDIPFRDGYFYFPDNFRVDIGMLYRNKEVTHIVFRNVTSIGLYAFYECTNLEEVVIQGPPCEQPSTMPNNSPFYGTKILGEHGHGTGYIVVPAEYLEQYKNEWPYYWNLGCIKAMED